MPEVPDILRRICEQRRRRVAAGDAGVSPARRLPAGASGRRFLDAISARRGAAVIAEIKMGSPKLGDLRGRLDPVARAAAYADAGAACLSVVVEPDHFHGGYDLLAECAAASGLPAVAKDFVVSDVQLAWARNAGACAVLLIAALYDAVELRRLAGLARGLGLVPLIETHDDADFEKLRPPARGDGEEGSSDWELVGINNRDLRTFEVDLERSAEQVSRLPASALKVAESGIHTGADVAKLRRAGFDAFLIGERLVLSGDPAAALSELLGGCLSVRRPDIRPPEDGRSDRDAADAKTRQPGDIRPPEDGRSDRDAADAKTRQPGSGRHRARCREAASPISTSRR